ncbi:related to Ubiquitin-conjugating enzyme E2-24 kDa [Saccharomycodes ludwigii]|uniref:Ubiquitin-conjugating enzyme E2 H n=1 Tax=Saccharomycodes ludwigii TaxID=36035 RepID=A0A376B767_9ASCO|nr:hypothetical protein SCDLUD_003518 [Saccharomycodes ludwigii]KAH3900531.1 hypothetical protein SCDLUD_003518 [Saccharomycodes ludwigii]SSD60492.1 related to Ubiquitin-conjugating enzyme E2-24 kDa [Saccharomycodes ludwigii]
MSSHNKRIETDVKKLFMSNHEVILQDDSDITSFGIKFNGPRETPYENGIWRLHVELPKEYPFKSPSIGFENRIYHPNIDFESGTICLDVMNTKWSPIYDLVNVVEWMIPGLLKEPNGSDPMNKEAANLQLSDPKSYEERIRSYVEQYANKKAYIEKFGKEDDYDEDGDISNDEEYDDDDDHDGFVTDNLSSRRHVDDKFCNFKLMKQGGNGENINNNVYNNNNSSGLDIMDSYDLDDNHTDHTSNTSSTLHNKNNTQANGIADDDDDDDDELSDIDIIEDDDDELMDENLSDLSDDE